MSVLPIVKRRKGCQQYPDQNKDEQAITESSLNKLVGAADVYNLEVEQFECLSLLSEFRAKMVCAVINMFLLIPLSCNSLGDGTPKITYV